MEHIKSDDRKIFFKKLFIILFLITVFIIVVGSLLTGYYVGGIYKDWLSRKDASMEMMKEYYNLIVVQGNEKKIRYFNPLNPFGNSPPTRIYDRNNILIGEYMPPAYEVVNIDDINVLLENMLLIMEDQKFYNHKGVNYIRTTYLAVKMVLSRRIVGGGSTITQQLAKLLFTKSEKTFERKVLEMFMAHEIERNYTKREILAMYFNTVYLGDGNYGFEAASNYYFDKLLKDCRLVEYAILISMLPNPTYYSIINNPENNRKKVAQILARMASHGFIDKETAQAELLLFDKNYSNLTEKVSASQLGMTINRTPYVNEYVRQHLLNFFEEDQLALSGLKIYTTVSERDYRISDAIMKRHIRKIQATTGDQSFQGAFVSIDVKTGGIITMIGGSGYTLNNQFNRATQAKRPVGSVIKPFIYLYAFETGLQPFSMVIDTNYTYPQGIGKPPWSPRNYNRRYSGEITLETALFKSVNTVAVKLLYDIGLGYFIKNATEFFGSSAYIPNALSLGLGTLETTPLSLASANTVLANYGVRFSPYIVERIIDDNDEEIDISSLVDRTPKVIDSTSPSSYYYVNSTLQKVLAPGGTGASSARAFGITYPSFSAKTGTSSDHKDTWFSVYNADISVVAWLGSDKNNRLPNNATGGVNTALASLEYLVAVTPKDKLNFLWNVPDDIEVVEICEVSNLPINYTCEESKSLSIRDVDITAQCGIDHLKSGVLNDATNSTDDDDESSGVIMLEEESIVDPTIGKLRN